LDVNFDYTNDWVDVQEQITVFNRWPDTLNTLVLVVEPNHTPGVFTLNSLVMNGSSLQSPDGYTLEGHELRISLPSPLIPGQSLTLSINYHLDLPLIQSESGTEAPTPFGYSDHQTNLVSWYPYLAAYDPGSGWLVHDRYYFGEHEVYDVADYTVNLTLVNPPADLKIAASAPAETQGGVLHYSLPGARTFAISASFLWIITSFIPLVMYAALASIINTVFHLVCYMSWGHYGACFLGQLTHISHLLRATYYSRLSTRNS